MSFAPTARPTESPSILHSVETLDREALRDRVKTMTAADLDQLVDEMNDIKEMPTVFKDQEVQQALEQRMEELHVKMDVQDRWQGLRASISQKKEDLEAKAEDSFVKSLVDKGGGRAMIAVLGITVLAWLGFKSAKKLKDSIEGKGFLKTAIEGAKEHPILMGLLAAIGVKAGTQAYQYFTENGDAIEKRIKEQAAEKGVSAEEEAKTIGDKVKQAINTSTDVGLSLLIRGLSGAIGGEYDEKTGVVTIPGATLRPPVVIVAQGAFRRSFSIPFLQSRFSAVMQQARIVGVEMSTVAAHKYKLAERGRDLLNKQTQIGFGTKEAQELESILGTLEKDLKMTKANILNEVQMRPDEIKKKLAFIEQEMERARRTEVIDFNATKQAVDNLMSDAEKKIARGDFQGDIKTFRENTIRDGQKLMADNKAHLIATKVPLGKQWADTLDQLSGKGSDAVAFRAKQQMESATFGGGSKTKFLETATRKATKYGLNLRKLPGGGIVLGAVAGYSFLPMALEGIATLRAGEKGKEARKALALDAGEAVGGFIPGVGEVLDLKAAFMGTDLNGRELDTTARLTSGVMGALGAASIGLGFFTGGLSIVGFRAIRGALAARKAVKVVKMANKGVEVTGVTSKSIKTINAAQKNADKLEDMLKLTNAQKKAHRAKNIVDNAQRTVQLTTYGHLGWQIGTGVMDIYTNTEGFVQNMQNKATQGVEAVENFVSGTTAS